MVWCRGQIRCRTPPEEVEQRYASLPPYLESALLPFQASGERSSAEAALWLLLVGRLAARLTVLPLLPPGPPVQREGVRFGLERRGRVLLADEMGVGKTVQAIALSACYQVRSHSTSSCSVR